MGTRSRMCHRGWVVWVHGGTAVICYVYVIIFRSILYIYNILYIYSVQYHTKCSFYSYSFKFIILVVITFTVYKSD